MSDLKEQTGVKDSAGVTILDKAGNVIKIVESKPPVVKK